MSLIASTWIWICRWSSSLFLGLCHWTIELGAADCHHWDPDFSQVYICVSLYSKWSPPLGLAFFHGSSTFHSSYCDRRYSKMVTDIRPFTDSRHLYHNLIVIATFFYWCHRGLDLPPTDRRIFNGCTYTLHIYIYSTYIQYSHILYN